MVDDERDERIRRKAHEIWEQEGRPSGRADIHWDMASELIAIQDNHDLTTVPLAEVEKRAREGEPILAVENAGSFPTLTDQDEQQIPHRPDQNA